MANPPKRQLAKKSTCQKVNLPKRQPKHKWPKCFGWFIKSPVDICIRLFCHDMQISLKLSVSKQAESFWHIQLFARIQWKELAYLYPRGVMPYSWFSSLVFQLTSPWLDWEKTSGLNVIKPFKFVSLRIFEIGSHLAQQMVQHPLLSKWLLIALLC